MNVHERQQFDFFFNTAVERFVERVEQRCGGPVPGLTRLRLDPNAEGVWVDEFVAALFADFLLDNPAGAAFVLASLSRRPLPTADAAMLHGEARTIGDWMQLTARKGFATILVLKTDEALEQRLAFQVVD
ncbi:MAG TPA: hypothetical protein VGE27_06840 [Gemmatimonas sp.]|uniref:hypothetical protein n=1 Tax=Gemmatimonas sp. TaxID=1962908 RepID=UPI002ED85360